jgi:16S rRNA (cytosine1402-N4)-methyltransferase
MTENTSPKCFSHRSVLALEAPEALVHNPDGVYVDATFGRGGHSRTILEKLSGNGRLIAFDRDPEAVEAARTITDPRFTIVHSAFSAMKGELAALGVQAVDGILMDIGVSSPQIDDPERGFSLRADGPLDMRMDTSRGMTAAEWLAAASEREIAEALKTYGEERFASRIAQAICRERASRPITRTSHLCELIARSVPRNQHDPKQNPATRSFQAIRIVVNGELDELTAALDGAGALLREDGRLVVISFHSLEDRIVKRFFELGAHPEREIDQRLALRASEMPLPWWKLVTRVKPGQAECDENPRSRSAVMRWAARTARNWSERRGGER